MVDLPQINNVQLEVRAPQTRVSPAQIAEPYNELAHNLEKGSQVLSEDVARPLARQAAATAITRDENGDVQVAQWPIVGDAAVDYARAVKVGAATDGENEARLRNVELRNEHRDDPESYMKAAGEYKKGLLQTFKAAGPEVQATLGRSFDTMSIETYRGLLNEKQTTELHRASRSIQAEIETTQNEMAGLANGGDTDSDGFRRRAAKMDALYGELVDNPRLAYPAARADFEKKQFYSGLQADGLAHDVAGKVYDAGGPQAAMKAADAIRTDPKLNLTPGQREAYYNRAVGAIRQRFNTDAKADKAVETEIDDVADIAAQGYNPTPERMATLKNAVAANKNPEVARKYEAMIEAMPVVANWRQMSPMQLEQELATRDARMREKGVTEEDAALMKTGAQLLKKMQAGLKADPLDWANRTGAVSVPPIDFASKSAPADMRGRIAAAETVADHYGIKPTYLTVPERRFLEATAAKGGDAMLGLSKSIVDGFGSRAQAVLGEISKQAPVLAHTGGLLSGSLFGGGSVTFANDVAEAVAMRANPDAAKTLPHWATAPSDKIQLAQRGRVQEQYGDAFLMVPSNGRAAQQSANAAFTTRALRNNYDATLLDASTPSQKAYDQSLQEAAGATFTSDGTQYGGVANIKPGYWRNYKTIVPGNIRADRFKDVIGAITDDDLKKLPISPETFDKKPYTSADLRNAVPVAVPGGYRFAHGDPASDSPKWLRGADGRPFVLDLDKLEPALRQRVPGAYQGGGGRSSDADGILGTIGRVASALNPISSAEAAEKRPSYDEMISEADRKYEEITKGAYERALERGREIQKRNKNLPTNQDVIDWYKDRHR